MSTDCNQLYMQKALACFPGGVNSPVRQMSAVGSTSLCMQKGEGCHLWDLNNKRYIDYIGGWGAMIAGHAHPLVIEAVQKAMSQGFVFGTNTPGELVLAEMLKKRLPVLEKMRFTSSGTESTMSLVRLMRGFTGRSLIVKCEGCFHGHSDALLVKAGSGLLTFGLPRCLGVPAVVAADTLVLPYNDCEALAYLMKEKGHEIAGIILEPIAGNMGLVIPDREWLTMLRSLCDHYGALLIFDEVMSGFRVHRDSAQGLFGVKPDLLALGKVVGGGMPLAVYGGRSDIMNYITPAGGVYHSGTFAGHPLAAAAGAATIQITNEVGFYDRLSSSAQQLVSGLNQVAQSLKLSVFQAQSVGGMFSVYFLSALPKTYADVAKTNTALFSAFFNKMLSRGILFPPSAFEACFISIAHTPEIIETTIASSKEALGEMKEEGLFNL